MFAHKGVRWITFGWVAFIGENLVLSHNREYIIDTFGKQKYHGLYNILSSAACLSIAYGYLRYGRNQGPVLSLKYWKPNSVGFRLSAFSFQSVGLIGISQSFPKFQNPVINIAQVNSEQNLNEIGPLQSETATASVDTLSNTKFHFAAQCPIDWKPKDVPSDGVYGVHRISRHPTFFSLGLFGLGIALKTQFATRAIVCGFPLLFALIGGSHQDYRHRRNSGGYLSPEMDEKTSLIPFVALFTGKQSWKEVWDEMKHVNMTIGLLLSMYLNASLVFITMSNNPNVEIVHIVTYNKRNVTNMSKQTENSFKHSQSRYFGFLLVICIGSTIVIPVTLIFFIGIMFPFISIASQSLWQIALYVIISCILSMIICHCYRYETFELYFNNKSIQKRITDNGWSNVTERMKLQIEDANTNTIKTFKRLPYVLRIANRIDKNVLWFVRKTIIHNNKDCHINDKHLAAYENNGICLKDNASEQESLSLINNGNDDSDIEFNW